MSLESQFDGNLETFDLNVPRISEPEKQMSQTRAIMQKASQGRYVQLLIDAVSLTSEKIRQPTLHP
jgi:hypothetical protein